MFDVLAAFHSPILCMKIENLTLSQLFSHFSNWFMLYCFSRTLSNSLRLFSILLALRETFQQLFLCFKEVGFGCGSSGLCLSDQQVQSHGCVFACLSFSRHITDSDSFFWRWLLLGMFWDCLHALTYLCICLGKMILVLGLNCLLDCFMYGTWILVPLNFLKFNFLSVGGDYYGTHKWHWYFTQGFPVMISLTYHFV
ncbi:GPI mannosyltransferase 3 [Glycine max]|nr:GPI mannosyltransferase 3 [Glycine max]